jgi:hypothetical protein
MWQKEGESKRGWMQDFLPPPGQRLLIAGYKESGIFKKEGLDVACVNYLRHSAITGQSFFFLSCFR